MWVPILKSKILRKAKSTGIYVYELNTNTGKLTYVSSSPHTVNPSYLVADNENKTLICCK